MKKEKIYYLIALMPIIDLITSFQTRFFPEIFSIGIIIKSILIFISCYYITFKSSSKYKKYSIIMLLLFAIYGVGYFALKPELLQLEYLINEFKYLFKIIYFPIIFLALLNYFDEYGFNKNKFINSLIITLIEYTILLLLPNVLNLSFTSYDYDLKGSIGWFFAANEVSAIMVILFPFIYYLINKKKWLIIVSIPILYAISLIGTKVTLFGILIICIGSLIFNFIFNKFKIDKKNINSFIILLIALMMFFGVKTTINNMSQVYNDYDYTFNEEVQTDVNSNNIKTTKKVNHNLEDEKEEENDISIEIEKEKTNQILKYLLSSRDIYYYSIKNVYNETFSFDYIFFGMGFSNTSKTNNGNITQLIEIDYLDMYFHGGSFGLILNLTPVIFLIYKIAKFIFRKKHEIETYCKIAYNLMIICLILCIALIAGHILFAPSVSFYLVLYIIMLLNEIKLFEKKKIDNNKINILALHLNHGGVENVLINQANMLVDNYNVEIICLYNNNEKIPFAVNEKVKITYLMDTISNKEELKNAIKELNFIKIIKEGLKAIKILYLKPLLIKKSIINSDAKVIISTRQEFSKILGNNKRKGVITIGEEHNHHDNNKKYIKTVIKSNKNIDYLLPASKELADFYNDKVVPKVEYIPNSLNYYPKKTNLLNTNKLIAIGRLSKEKGFVDLIEVIKEVVKYDTKITLDIYGDGVEKSVIEKKIKEEQMENNIFLKGFVSQEELRTNLKKYSILLLPSYKESFGLAALEAMSYGIPTIMYDTAKGPLEFINEQNGIIIKNRDSLTMSKNIIELLNNSQKIKELSINCRKTSEEYSFNIIKTKLNNFINSVIENS